VTGLLPIIRPPVNLPPVALTLREDSLILDLLEPRLLISSAPHRGGLTSSRYVVNSTVPRDYCPPDVPASIAAHLETLGLPPESSTACVTAVNVWDHVQTEASGAGFRCTVFVTAGIGNLSSPGLTAVSDQRPGTINLIALLEADLPPAALVEAVQIVTEVKARVLAGRVTHDGHPATGTSTDTVTVVLLPGPASAYCGAVTPVGNVLARAVEGALSGALDTA
jgi:adenosylcobinamide amidohydrolase